VKWSVRHEKEKYGQNTVDNGTHRETISNTLLERGVSVGGIKRASQNALKRISIRQTAAAASALTTLIVIFLLLLLLLLLLLIDW
jgi:hypothetical protein